MNFSRFVSFFYFSVITCLFFYSFTQIDLSLSLTKHPAIFEIQKVFQYVGFFNRPLSTAIFVSIISLMFLFYGYFLYKSHKSELSNKYLWILILGTSGILALSYNAFSYDIFNYIFDAKIITLYKENPYFHKALDYPNDPMLSFMRWTHRVFPYGPVWLGLTVPLSLLGMKIFILTFFLFKFLIAGLFLGSCYLILKINKKINSEDKNFGLVLFALNPLVIIESLVSAHNDVAMIFFALWGIYLFFNGKKILSIILILISSQIKIPTIGLLIPLSLSYLPNLKFFEARRNIILVSILSMTLVLFSGLLTREIQPWYLLWVLPFVAIYKKNKYLVTLIIGASLGLVLRYCVYIFYGNWDEFDIIMRNLLTIFFTVIPFSLLLLKENVHKFIHGRA